jgi:TonB family protein
MKTSGESTGRRRVFASVLIGGIVLFAIAILNISKNRHAQQNDGPTTDLSQSSNDYQQSSSPASGDAESVIRISAENLLADFQRSEADKELRIKNESLSTYLNDKTETAEDRYTSKRIQVTGIVTGVFIPSIETSRRVLESRGTGISDEQGGAGSFVTMGGPYPHSVEETLLLPGIEAWSKTGDSLQPTFGQPNIESLVGRLVVGKEASILCTFRSSSGSSPTKVSISLEDCILEPSPLTVPTLPAPVAGRPAPPASPASPTSQNIMNAIHTEDSSPENQAKPYPVDIDLESDVRKALSASKALKGAIITPVLLHREATLSGTVEDKSSRELAEEITSHVLGVVAVHNNLTIGVGDGLYRVGSGVSAPVPLNSVEAEFTDEARRAKYGGVCLVSMIVDAQGNPQNLRVVRALGKGLDEKALEAAHKYKFKPAMKDGNTPVPVMITIEVNFRLY